MVPNGRPLIVNEVPVPALPDNVVHVDPSVLCSMRYPVIAPIGRPVVVVVGAVHDSAIEPLDIVAANAFGAAVVPYTQADTGFDTAPHPMP
jgi:hypothetical protein